MQTRTQTEPTNRTLIASLMLAAATTTDRTNRLLLLAAATKVGQLEKLTSVGATPSAQPFTRQISDRQLSLLQHCLGMYDPEEATECEHFEGEKPPTDAEAFQLLILLDTADVTLHLNQEKFDTFIKREAELATSEDGWDEEAETSSGFFQTVNGADSYPNRAQVVQTLSDVAAENGPLPKDPEERIKKGVEVGKQFLTRIMQDLPKGDEKALRAEMKAQNDHLGMHIENGDIPNDQLEHVAGFHNFMEEILDNHVN